MVKYIFTGNFFSINLYPLNDAFNTIDIFPSFFPTQSMGQVFKIP